MKAYELSILFHPDLEMNLDPAIDKVRKLIEANGGKITKEENDGKKRMAYKIKGQTFAVYYYFFAELPAAAPGKITSSLNISDEVIRHMIVLEDERKAKMEARQKAASEAEESTVTAEKEA